MLLIPFVCVYPLDLSTNTLYTKVVLLGNYFVHKLYTRKRKRERCEIYYSLATTRIMEYCVAWPITALIWSELGLREQFSSRRTANYVSCHSVDMA